MVKVPATREGIPAIEALTAEGVNVNVTLLFSRGVYAQVLDAYMSGLEARVARGEDVSRIASVASFFVSRVDTMVDAMLEAPSDASPEEKALRKRLVGKVAIANAKLAYQDWKAASASPRFKALEAKGARPQRLLWASTSAKDPRFDDLLYVEALVGPETVDTMPLATLDALRDHGRVESRIERNVEGAREVMDALARTGISIDEVTDKLVEDGVKAFASAFDSLMSTIEKKRTGALRSALNPMTCQLPPLLRQAVDAELDGWHAGDKVHRLFARDASLWTGRDEAKWLDWLAITKGELSESEALHAFAEQVRGDVDHAVVLGMGGSSLFPDVLAQTFPSARGYPVLRVLDSTDPAQIRTLEGELDLARTLFIVSSKSGTTLEPNLLADYFYARVRDALGEERAGSRFVAITDPGSALERRAEAQGFAHVFFGVPGIGGRYSALSSFGMFPAAMMGLDVPRFLERARYMEQASASCVPPAENPSVRLGAVLGVSARAGRDKVTLVASPGLAEFGAWLEQLLAESTGKEGKGIVPVDREPLGAPEHYGRDRLFVYLRHERAPDAAQDAAIDALERAGHPVVRIALDCAYELAQEVFRFEMATAVAGSILGIDPFDQPDVEASKVAARKLTEAYERDGSLPEERPFVRDGALALFADDANRAALVEAAPKDASVASYLAAHLARAGAGDYVALLAYLERSDAHAEMLEAMRRAIRDRYRVATCLGFGPRFLHSTGQAYKGGPATGVFVQLTWDAAGNPAQDLAIPGHRASFGVVLAAQARGDLQVLEQRGRRALRVDLGPDVGAGLEALGQALAAGLR